MKIVTVNLPGTGTWREVEIAPGTTPRDVLKELSLGTDYHLSPWKSAEAFADGENLYLVVEDGAKLQAVSAAEVAGCRSVRW